MKKILTALTLLLILATPASSMMTCTKTDFNTEIYSYTALVSGQHTFKGGNVIHSPNGYLTTVNLLAGETWTVPDGLAAISHVTVCTEPPVADPADCVYRDPAFIRYKDTTDTFKLRGALFPTQELDYSTGVTVQFGNEDNTLAVFSTPTFTSRGRITQSTSSNPYIRVTRNRDDSFTVKIKFAGIIEQTTDPNIAVDIFIGNQWFRVEGIWQERKYGWILRNKDYVCPTE